MSVPFFGGKGESCSNNAREVELRSRVTNLEPTRRASALIMNIDPVAREARKVAGNDQIMDPDGVPKILQVPNDYLAPDAVDPIH